MCTLEIPEGMTEADWQRARDIYKVEKTDSNEVSQSHFPELIYEIPLTRKETQTVFRLQTSTQYIQ